ncbi:MAG: AMP-dependent synthetase/ligase, partial [Candidatus Acidiferrales bacterium]
MDRDGGTARNVSEPFAAVAEQHRSLPAIEMLHRDGVDTVTWGELREWAERTAAWLVGQGVRPGDRCAVLAENSGRWCAAFWGVLRSGAVVVPLDTNYKPNQVARLLGDSGARLLFVSPRLLAVARQATQDFATPPALVLLHGSDGSLPTLDEIVRRDPGPLPECPATPGDPAIIMYTSGTTSDPKGVVLSHSNLLAILEAVPQVFRVNEQDSLLAVLPLFHALPLVVNLLLPAAVGGRSVFIETINTTELLRAFAERNPTVFVCVPQFFYLIRERVLKEVERGGWLKRTAFRWLLRLNGALRGALGLNLGRVFFAPVHKVFGRRMRMLVSGGSRFDPDIQRDFYRLGLDILQGYGLTECAGPATVTREGERAFGTVGHPLPGMEVKILPPEAEADGEKRDGEVAIRGPNVMQGYFNRPDATAAAVRGGWLHTGDLGVLDAQGRLFITGRAKDVIVLSSGKNIYPEEIEAHYLESPFIKELCVLGLTRPHDGGGERLHAVVVPDLEVMRERKVVNTREILRFEIEGRSLELPSHKRVLSYEVWTGELPRTTTRKLRRFEIEARVREGKQAA